MIGWFINRSVPFTSFFLYFLPSVLFVAMCFHFIFRRLDGAISLKVIFILKTACVKKHS